MLRTLQTKLSVQKLILKNLQSKLLTLLVLSTVVPVSTVGAYGLLSSTNALTELSVSQVEKDVSTQALRIEQLLSSVNNDVIMLSQMPPIQGIIRARENQGIDTGESQQATSTSYKDWVGRASTIFQALLTTRSPYKTVQYLDEKGNELVRVEAGKNGDRANPRNTAGNAQADFFRGAIRLKAGQTYISGITLEAAHQPGQSPDNTIHYATPIYNAQGTLRGVLVITILAQALGKSLQLQNNASDQTIFLATQTGQYIWNSRQQKELAAQSANLTTLKTQYTPQVAQKLLNGKQGSIYNDLYQIISYQTINPGQNHQMVIVYDQPKSIVFQSIRQFKRLSAGIIALSLGTVLFIGISIVRKLSKSQTLLYEEAKNAAKAAETKAQQLEQALQELHKTQSQLVQTEKMSSLGQLVAGVAHEINNPVNFIYGNLTHVDRYTYDLLSLIELYQQHYPKPNIEIQQEADAIDIDFLIEDMPKMLASMKVGADRIRQIVLSLRNFSRLDESEMKAVDIHEGLDSTLLILQNRLKARGHFPGVEIDKNYGQLPLVECYAGQLNQVFMNILSNGIDALEEAIQVLTPRSSLVADQPHPTMPLSPLRITIKTEQYEVGWVKITIADNGPGMPAAVRDRLFEPFFTTKPIGRGTGLGLSISYQIVTEKHGGNLRCISALEQGTEFHIEIPIQQSNKLSLDPVQNSAIPLSVA